MGRSAQRKGATGERELADILRSYGYEIDRGGSLSYGKLPDLYGLPYIHIEVKRVERLNLSEAMKQSERDCVRFLDGYPAVFHRKNREKWRVTMNLSDWLQLYEKYRAGTVEEQSESCTEKETQQR